MFAWLKSFVIAVKDFFIGEYPDDDFYLIGNGLLPKESELNGPAVTDPLHQASKELLIAAQEPLSPVQQIHRLSEFAQNNNCYGDVSCRFSRQPIDQLFAGAKVDKIAGTGLEWTYRLDDLTMCRVRYIANDIYVTIIDRNQLN